MQDGDLNDANTGSLATPANAVPAPHTSKAGVDLNAVGQVEGTDIFDLDLESMEDKPWRKPGADITDYFNFGFNEATWRQYCMKQKKLREELLMQKRINVCHLISSYYNLTIVFVFFLFRCTNITRRICHHWIWK